MSNFLRHQCTLVAVGLSGAVVGHVCEVRDYPSLALRATTLRATAMISALAFTHTDSYLAVGTSYILRKSVPIVILFIFSDGLVRLCNMVSASAVPLEIPPPEQSLGEVVSIECSSDNTSIA